MPGPGRHSGRAPARRGKPAGRGWGRAWRGLWLASFAVGYLARYIDPRTLWWPQLFGILFPLLALGLLLMTAHALARRHYAWVLPAGLGLLLAGIRYLPPAAGAEGAGKGPVLVVMGANARVPDRALADRFAGVVETYAPDVIALQEAPFYFIDSLQAWVGAPHVMRVRTSLGYATWPIAGGGRVDAPILSRWPGEDYIRLSSPVPGALRGTRAVIRWAGQAVALYNVHLHSFRAGRDGEGRGTWWSPGGWLRFLATLRDDFRAQAAGADALREKLSGEPLPFLVCGDLNSPPHTWVYRQLTRLARDAYAVRRPWGGATFPARWPFLRLDYVLAGPGWHVVTARVGPYNGSDHRPVVAHLQRSAP